MNSLNVSESEIFGMTGNSGLKYSSPKRYHDLFRDNYQFSDASPLLHDMKLKPSYNSSSVICDSVFKTAAVVTNRSTRNTACQPPTSLEKSMPLSPRLPASTIIKSRLAKSKASPTGLQYSPSLRATDSGRDDLIENHLTHDPQPRIAVITSAPSTNPSRVESPQNDASMLDDQSDNVLQKQLSPDALGEKRFLAGAKVAAGSKEPFSSAPPNSSATGALAPRHYEDTASYRARRISHQGEDAAAYRVILKVRDDIKSSLVSLQEAERESMQRLSDVEKESLSRIESARLELAAQRERLEEKQRDLKTQQERFELQRARAKSDLDTQASELAAAASSLSQHHTAIVEERRRIAWQRLQLDLAMREFNILVQRQQPYSHLYRHYQHQHQKHGYGYPQLREEVQGPPGTAFKSRRLPSQRPRSASPGRKLHTDAHAHAEAGSMRGRGAVARGEELAGAYLTNEISVDTSAISVGSHYLYKRKLAAKGAWH